MWLIFREEPIIRGGQRRKQPRKDELNFSSENQKACCHVYRILFSPLSQILYGRDNNNLSVCLYGCKNGICRRYLFMLLSAIIMNMRMQYETEIIAISMPLNITYCF